MQKQNPLPKQYCFPGSYLTNECYEGQPLILNAVTYMQIVYFDLPLSLLQGVERGTRPPVTTQLLCLSAGPAAKGLNFMASEDRQILGQVLGGILDLLEEEVKIQQCMRNAAID